MSSVATVATYAPPEIIKQAQKQDAMLDTAIGKRVAARHRHRELLIESLAYFMAFCLAGTMMAAIYFAWLAFRMYHG